MKAARLRGGAAPARKGGAREREIVKLHRAIGVDAEKVPLSGGARYQGNGQDVDIHLPDGLSLRCQVKAIDPNSKRDGTKTVVKALGDADILLIRYDAPPGERVPPLIVVMPWRTYEGLLKNPRLRGTQEPGIRRNVEQRAKRDGKITSPRSV